MAALNILSTSAGAGAIFSSLSSSSFLILIIILTIIIIIVAAAVTAIQNFQPLVFITSLLSLLKPNQNHLLRESSLKCIPISSPSQANLREADPGNALLEFRGNAGSHDLPFSMKTLSALKQTEERSFESKLIPANGFIAFWCGGGTEPKVVVLFEGWMLGFKPLPMEVVQAVDPHVNFIYKYLRILFIRSFSYRI
ncbi:hypothetical protein OIU74_012243 [Salix koriyanagi]|uniref:Uncharacterized protein n=1 Tax=Salix koriyanagi TaxID=2511006 RepID=A0A9Q0Q6Q2_9ROSI|nr:hypothetical protein OIU74_012243 [Salix koriyanagi]